VVAPYFSESCSATVYHETTKLVWSKEVDCFINQGVCIFVALNPTIDKDSEKHTIRNTCVFGFCPSTSVLRTLKNTVVRKLDVFPSSGKAVGDTYFVPLESANLNQRTTSVSIATAI
jgi:hypothetical protein